MKITKTIRWAGLSTAAVLAATACGGPGVRRLRRR